MNINSKHYFKMLEGKTITFYQAIDVKIKDIRHYVGNSNYIVVTIDILTNDKSRIIYKSTHDLHIDTPYLSNGDLPKDLNAKEQTKLLSDIIETIKTKCSSDIYSAGVANMIDAVTFKMNNDPNTEYPHIIQSPDMSLEVFKNAMVSQHIKLKMPEFKNMDIKKHDVIKIIQFDIRTDQKTIDGNAEILSELGRNTIEFAIDMTTMNQNSLTKNEQSRIITELIKAIERYSTVSLDQYINNQIKSVEHLARR